MDEALPTTYTAFLDGRRLATGPLHEVAVAVLRAQQAHPEGQPLVFSNASGQSADLDLRGGEEANRLFVGLSDGQVEDQAQTAAVLKDARRRGIVTFGIYLGRGANQELMDELWGAGNWTAINSLDEMPKAVGQRLAALFNRLAQR